MVAKTTGQGKRGRTARGLGSLYKRDASGLEHPADWSGPGVYWLAYKLPGADGGKPKRMRVALRDGDGNQITARPEAEAARRRVMAPYQIGTTVDALRVIESQLRDATGAHLEAAEDAKAGLRVVDAWSRYVASHNRPDSGPVTLSRYGTQWGRFERWMGREMPAVKTLDGVTRACVEAYASDLVEAGLSGATFNKHVSLLSLVFRVLADDAGMAANPWQKIARRKHRVQERRELTTEELRRIIQTAEGEMRLLFAMGCYTGLRLGDCCTLLWTEVDLARGFIVRTPNKTAVRGKPVRVPIFRDLAAMLQEARVRARGEYVVPEFAALYKDDRTEIIATHIQRHFWNCGIECHAAGTGSQIERDANGNPVITEHGNVALKPTGKRAVVRCGFHSLRHTFVSLCREAGAPLSVVEAIVGHSNPAMTRHYSHTGDAESTRAVGMLPSVTGEGEAGSRKPEAGSRLAAREPLPAWALALVEGMTAGTWKAVKAELVKGA